MKNEIREVKGYTAIFDNLDGSFDYICHADTEERAEKIAVHDMGFDNERVRVYPYYDSPFEVL